MKFRNPKTGDILEDYVSFRGDFCCEYMCEDCPVGRTAKNGLCEKFVKEHPYEAAAMMGYEVVEDTIRTVPGHEPLTAEQQKDMAEFIDYKLAEKEANMDKPIICEVLGVNVEEKFTADTPYGKFERCVIGEDGLIYNAGTNVLCYIINHPESIIRKPRFTQQEVERAKAIRVLYPSVTGIVLKSSHIAVSTGMFLFFAEEDLFPSIKLDEIVPIDEIIGGAE